MAMSITLTGKKVALMEMDLRKPKLSKKMGLNKDPGSVVTLLERPALMTS